MITDTLAALDINAMMKAVWTIIKSIASLPFKILKALPPTAKYALLIILITFFTLIIILVWKKRHAWKEVQIN